MYISQKGYSHCMNIFLKEMKDYRKSFIFWSIGVAAFLLAGMSKYQGFINSGVSVSDMFKDLPTGFGAMFGLGEFDLGTVIGFYIVIAIYLAILLGVHAVLLGSGIFSKEETEKTAEFLFTKPISRTKIFFSKFLAAITISVALNIVSVALSITTVSVFNDGSSITGDILFLAPGILLVQLIFLMIGILFASIMKRPKKAGIISASILMGTYVLSAFLDISGKYKFLRYLTPFKYFDVKEIYKNGEYSILYLVAAFVFIMAAIYTSKRYFDKRDLGI